LSNETEKYKDVGRRIVEASRITGEFKLRSGATSTVYFDKYRFEAEPELLSDIAEQLHPLIPDGTERLIGLEMGGIPLATALSLKSGLKLGFCRKKAKEYGTRLQVEGGVGSGERVTIVEDVITSGGAALDAIRVLRDIGCEILAVLCVVDREAGAVDKFGEEGVDFRPLYKWSRLEELREKQE
jgi:orotate phosphoribosyltransferase